MALQDSDLFLVNRNQTSYRMPATELATYLDDGSGTGASVHVGVSAPTDPPPEQGDLWWKSDEGILYVYYVDGSSSQWVQAAGQGGAGTEDLYVNIDGDLMTGTLSSTEREITGLDFDLASGNFFFVNTSIDVPAPTNGVAGTNGVIKFADGAAPTSWATEFKFPGGTPFDISGETIVPFYVKSASEILVGYPTGDY